MKSIFKINLFIRTIIFPIVFYALDEPVRANVNTAVLLQSGETLGLEERIEFLFRELGELIERLEKTVEMLKTFPTEAPAESSETIESKPAAPDAQIDETDDK